MIYVNTSSKGVRGMSISGSSGEIREELGYVLAMYREVEIKVCGEEDGLKKYQNVIESYKDPALKKCLDSVRAELINDGETISVSWDDFIPCKEETKG